MPEHLEGLLRDHGRKHRLAVTEAARARRRRIGNP